jgi:hypothetical protein
MVQNLEKLASSSNGNVMNYKNEVNCLKDRNSKEALL